MISHEQHTAVQIQRIETLARDGGVRRVVDDLVMAEAWGIPPTIGAQQTLACLLREYQGPLDEDDILYLDNIFYIRQTKTLWTVVSGHLLTEMMSLKLPPHQWLDVLMSKQEFHYGFQRWAGTVRVDAFTQEVTYSDRRDDWARVWDFIWKRGVDSEACLGTGYCWLMSGQPELRGQRAAVMWKLAQQGSLPVEVCALIKKSALKSLAGEGNQEQEKMPDM